MKMTVSLCTRVEGHGNIKFFLQKDEISNVNFEVQAIRGFENILSNKKLIDVPRIVSRVCGLCYGSQSIASCKAIEDLFEIEPSNQSILLRRLLMIGELINSHSTHFFFQAFPDLFVILKGQVNPLPLEDLIRFDPQLTSIMIDLIRIGKELVNIFGGRSAHPITPTIGGMAYPPSKKNIGNARKYLQKAVDDVKWVLERFQELFSQVQPPDSFSIANSTFFGLHNNEKYDRYDGTLRLMQNTSTLADFPVKNYTQYIDRDRTLPGIHAYLKEDHKLLVGPIARYEIIKNYRINEIDPYLDFINKSWKKNLVLSNYLYLVEILRAAFDGLAILEDTKLTNPIEIPPLNSIKKAEGIGVVEAPRGTLIHHYIVNNSRMSLDKVKLFVATEINIPTINDILTRECKILYEKVHDLEEVKKTAQMIVRSFDPCISCATH